MRGTRLVQSLFLLIVGGSLSITALAQGKPGGGTPGGTTTGGTTGTTTGTTGGRPAPSIPNPFPNDISRPVYISGQVVLDNGAPVPEPVPIQRVCGTSVRRETYTDSHGNFSILISDGNNNNNGTFQDASEGGMTTFGNRPSQVPRSQQLWGCDIRAMLPGYTSSIVSLAGFDFSSPVNLGSVVLHHNGAVDGNSISVISLKAPDKARKEYEKGHDDFFKKKYGDAEKHLAKAVELYPQYASAWELLGRSQRQQQQDAEAEKSLLSAISADDKYVPPYLHLAALNANRSQWPDVVRLTDKAIQLDPMNYPDIYFLNAAAHFNLKQMPEAEKSARKAVDIDKEHRFPRAELLLGSILRIRGDNVSAAEHLRNFVKMDPNSPEVPNIQAFLAKFDEQNATAKAAPKPN